MGDQFIESVGGFSGQLIQKIQEIEGYLKWEDVDLTSTAEFDCNSEYRLICDCPQGHGWHTSVIVMKEGVLFEASTSGRNYWRVCASAKSICQYAVPGNWQKPASDTEYPSKRIMRRKCWYPEETQSKKN